MDHRQLAKLNPHGEYNPEDLKTLEGMQNFLRD